jgi:ankyrin repeat protein
MQPNKRMKALKTVPKDIFTAYRDVIERIENSYGGNNKELALRIFSWLFYAQRPLLMNELLDALAVDSEESTSDGDEEDDGDEESQNCKGDGNLLQPEQVIEVCRSLVVYDELSGSVRFVHHTVQEFIAQELKPKLQTPYLAKTCLEYLASFNEPCSSSESIKNRIEKYKFSRYAAEFWGFHAREAEDYEEVQKAVLEFLSSEGRMNSMVQLDAMNHIFKGRSDLRQTILHVIAKNGLAVTCNLVLSARLNVHHAYLLTRPFLITKRSGDWLQLLQLGKKQTDLATRDECGNSGLHYASQGGHVNVVEILLAAKVDVSIQNGDGDTSLHKAAWGGRDKVVEILLAAKADVLIQNNNGSTALHHAADKGHDKVVEILLAAKADADSRDSDGRTALYQAARGGNDKVVKSLLVAEANVEVRDNDGRTALQWAAWNGHDKAVELLATKANVDAQGDRGWTALHFAAWRGYDKVVEILLAKANAEVRDNDGLTALFWARRNGHDKVVKVLAIKASMNM